MLKGYTRKFLCALFGVASLSFSACHSSHQLLEPSLSLTQKRTDPQFLDNISLGSNTTNIRISAAVDLTTHETGHPAFSNVLQTKYADLLKVVPGSITNLALYGFIEDWYGVRYRLGGNNKEGIDCSAFVQRLYESVFCTDLVRTAIQQYHSVRYILNKDSLKEGDLVFFKTRGKRISHVGVYLTNSFFVHASSTQGVTISSLDDVYWSRFYAGAGKIKKEQTGSL